MILTYKNINCIFDKSKLNKFLGQEKSFDFAIKC